MQNEEMPNENGDWRYWGYSQKFFRRNGNELHRLNYISLIRTLNVMVALIIISAPFSKYLMVSTKLCGVFAILFIIVSFVATVRFKYGNYSQARFWVLASVILVYLFSLTFINKQIPITSPIIIYYMALPSAFVIPKHYTYPFIGVSSVIFFSIILYLKGPAGIIDILFTTASIIVGCSYGKSANQAKMDSLAKDFLLETDSLTKVRNTKYLNKILKKLPTNDDVSIAFIDIDYFKIINDSIGHDAADQLIIVLAQKLQNILSDHGVDLIRRSDAGDEFIVVATGYSARNISALLQECLYQANKLELCDEKIITETKTGSNVERYGSAIPTTIEHVGISGGFTTRPPHGHIHGNLSEEQVHELFIEAETAMRYSKNNGRNRITRFISAMSNNETTT